MFKSHWLLVPALLAANGPAVAGITTGTPFTVQVTVTAGCTINTGSPTGTYDFGPVAGTAATPTDISANVLVTCTNTSPYTLYFTSSNTVTGNTARIMKPATGTDTVPYQIRQGATAIGNTSATGFGATGNGSSQTTAINFHITNWSPTVSAVAPAVYSDTVTLQVNF